MKRAWLLAAAAILILGYPWLFRPLFGLTTVYLLQPGLLHVANDLGGHGGLIALHFAVSILLSTILMLPIAALITVVFRKMWWVFAATLALELIWPDIANLPNSWRIVPDHSELAVSYAMDLATVLLSVMSLTYLMSRRMSCDL